MSGINTIFDVASRSMSAQLVRLNTIASNLANAGNISGTEDEAYRAMKPIFKTTYAANVKDSGISTTEVAGITTSERRRTHLYAKSPACGRRRIRLRSSGKCRGRVCRDAGSKAPVCEQRRGGNHPSRLNDAHHQHGQMTYGEYE